MTGTTVLLLLFLVVGLLLGAVFGVLYVRGRDGAQLARVTAERDAAEDRVVELTQERTAVGQQMSGQAVVKEALDRLHAQLNQLEQGRAAWQSQLHQQVNEVRMSGEALRRETASCRPPCGSHRCEGAGASCICAGPSSWPGWLAHCDFTEQTTTVGEDGLLRPDLVVRLAEGKNLVVDSKVPLAAFLEAAESDDADFREDRCELPGTCGPTWINRRRRPTGPAVAVTEFVIPVRPRGVVPVGGARRRAVVARVRRRTPSDLATPTTLIATLRAAAYAWNQSALTESAQQVFELGRELYERLSTMGDHLNRVGRSLTSAVEAYNGTVGSFERRVFISARNSATSTSPRRS